MKVLLIKPYWPYPYGRGEHTYNRIWPPLCLDNCAAILEKEHHGVEILDAHALRIEPKRIAAYINGFDKIFITSSSLDRWQCPNINISPFLETVRRVKEITDEIYVLGYHGTVDPGNILDATGAKAVVRGGPEPIVSDICGGKDFSQIRGLTYHRNGHIVSNPDRHDFDLRDLPTPAFHLLDTKRYFYEVLGKDFGLFEIGRGCNYSCKFCNKIMYGQRMAVKSKEQIQEEIRTAVEENGVRTGYFIDLEFLAHKSLVKDMCDFLIKKEYDFRWCCQTRADSLSPEILDKMKQAGCQLIHMGVESGIQKFLDFSDKHTTEEKLIEGVRMCEDAGIKTLAFFMFGFRGETAEDRDAVFKFAKKLNTNFVSFHKMHSYIPSDVYLPDINLNREMDRYIRNLYLRYYLRISYLSKENIMTLIRGLKLFLGRLATLA